MHIIQNKLFIWVGSSFVVILLISVIIYQQFDHHASTKTIDFNQSLGSGESVAKPIQSSQTKTTPAPAKQLIIVDIKGAVKKPGVYQFTLGERVNDAIQKAGGLKDDADQRQINLAEKLFDEMVIYVPIIGEVLPTSSTIGIGRQDHRSDEIDINRANITELEVLQGIGPAKAQAIIDYRSQNGPFKTINDLLKVSGIGEKSLEKIKAHITIK